MKSKFFFVKIMQINRQDRTEPAPQWLPNFYGHVILGKWFGIHGTPTPIKSKVFNYPLTEQNFHGIFIKNYLE